jgi:hypothetical protein
MSLISLAVGVVVGAVLAVACPKVYAYVKSKIITPAVADVAAAKGDITTAVDAAEKKL